MYRVMYFPGHISGGVGSVVMNIFRNIDRGRFSIDFCVPDSDRGNYDEEITKAGSRVFHIPQIKSVGPIKFINAVKSILINNGPYDAVHVHSVHMGALAIKAAKKAGVEKRIYHVHNTQDAALDHLPLHYILESVLRKSIIKNSTVYLACGQKAGQYIYGNRPFIVINNAVDVKRFHPFDEDQRRQIKESLLKNRDQKYVVGNIARFSTVKNQRRLVDIACLDKSMLNVFTFLLVGDGETLSELKEYVKEKKCGEKVFFTGQRVDTENMYNAMDVFCLPSYFEGLPVTMIEAQACGLPCLVSNVITKECDLSITEIEYLSLDESDQKWLDALYCMLDKRVTDKDRVESILKERRYELTSMVKQIEVLYQ